MIFIQFGNVFNGKTLVGPIHFEPHVLSDEDKKNGILVESIAEEPQPEFGKNQVLYVDPNTGETWYEAEARPLNMHEEIAVLRQNNKTPVEKYAEIDKKGVDLETLRAAKIDQLKAQCTEAIYQGFTSLSLNKDFGFNDKDQANFSQQYLLVVGGDNKGADISWKTKTGVAKMTEAQFRTLVMESKDHKMTMQVRYWQKEAMVLAATTAEAIDAVVW
jgi:hypothetical protein